MSHQPSQQEAVARVELEPFPPRGYIILKGVASDGVLVDKECFHEAVDNDETRQFRIDRIWASIDDYEARVLGRRLTPTAPRPALRLVD